MYGPIGGVTRSLPEMTGLLLIDCLSSLLYSVERSCGTGGNCPFGGCVNLEMINGVVF